jgi:hypothetical protein
MKFFYEKTDTVEPIVEDWVEDLEFDNDQYERQDLVETLARVLEVERDIAFY